MAALIMSVFLAFSVNAEVTKHGLAIYCGDSLLTVLEDKGAPEEVKNRGNLIASKSFIAKTGYLFTTNQYENVWVKFIVNPSTNQTCVYATGQDIIEDSMKLQEQGTTY